MAKKILCVIRTSTKRQEIESQHNDMLGFLTSNGLNYKEDEIEWLEAKGASARKVNPEYLNLLATIKATILGSDTIKACAFWHLNRLGRWENYIVDMKTWFINNQIQVYVKTPNLTLLNPDGTLDNGANIAWGVFASMVAYDTMELMDKTTRGKKEKADKGLYSGGGIPYGFKVINEKVVEDPETIGNIKTIFEEYSTGNYSSKKLEVELKSRGLKFADYYIRKILNKEIYKPIVGEELWDKCQSILSGNRWTTKQSKNEYISLKVVKCSSCGSNCICVNGKYTCYKHHMAYRFTEPCTNKLNIKASVIDLVLFDIAYILEFESLKRIPDTSELEKKYNTNALKINQTYKDLDNIREKQNRLLEAYLDAIISKETRDKRNSGLLRENITLQAQLERLVNENDTLEEQIRLLKNPNLGDISKAMLQEDLTENYRRSLIKKHITSCIPTLDSHEGSRAVKIEVSDVFGEKYEYYYLSRNMGKTDADHLFTKDAQTGKLKGYLEPYSTSKYSGRWEIQRNLLREIINRTTNGAAELVAP